MPVGPLVSVPGDLVSPLESRKRELNEISLEQGDLRLSVAGGRVEIDARDGVAITSKQEVSLRSEAGLRFESATPGHEAGSSIRVDGW